MADTTRFEGAPDPGNEHENLARWLTHILGTPDQEEEISSPSSTTMTRLHLLPGSTYHIRFYQQLPDFVMALLQNDPRATVHYGPLLYHLVGCQSCHQGFLELYDALDAAIHPRGVRPTSSQGTPRTLEATPPRMLAHVCQTLISQAEAILRQAHRDHVDQDDAARALLQLAMKISSRITQGTVRRQALQDLVRVATLFDGPSAPAQEMPGTRAYTPLLATAGGVRGPQAGTLERPELNEPIILIQSQELEGRIVQKGQTLELHLQHLGPELRGRFVTIMVRLGSLIEPVRWQGGNPLSIRSTVPVDGQGNLVTPIGETALRLDNPGDHNLLEAMFLLLEVRPA
ncbi:MAG TPA: hypothetical protein VH593_00325 [Ktedonobacteraceae bacterium]|jgi:hypothetical protein